MSLLDCISKLRLKKEKQKEGLIILTTETVNIMNPNFKKVVEHMKGIFNEDGFIKLSYMDMDNASSLSHLMARPNANSKDFDLEYQAIKGPRYFLQASDVEQTICFFKDFLTAHRLLDFDLENNNWIQKYD